ncbi:hypothetical protein EKK58_10435 [Candidatus Dependentiae bacterium]|nr:MAG: hypothetical protein EKK58_10435 [Candidatus Dependentiae bacterium]
MKTVKLKFSNDMFYNSEVIFQAGKVYEVETEKGWADRWIKRGAEVVQDEVKPEVKEVEKPKDKPKNKPNNKKNEDKEDLSVEEL